MKNYFDPASAAVRYSNGRPFFHPQVIARVRSHLSLEMPVLRAIDVACGTGLSTLALAEVALQVVGVDRSAAMIKQAPDHRKIRYDVAPAERLPFSDSVFDLMTICSAFHWIERDRFLAEARRVLRPASWLIVYDNYFTAQISENAAFER